MTHRRRPAAFALLLLLLRAALLLSNGRMRVESFSLPPPDTKEVRVEGETAKEQGRKTEEPTAAASSATVHRLTIPLETPRPRPAGLYANLVELWNAPRPVSSLISTPDRSKVGEEVPYCIVSDQFTVEGESFRVLLYPVSIFDYACLQALLH